MINIQEYINEYEKRMNKISRTTLEASEYVGPHGSAQNAYIKEICRYEVIDKDILPEIFKELHKYDSASKQYDRIRQILILSNMRFVVNIAGKLSIKTTIPLEDLISEGVIGLMKAVEMFDETLKVPFVNFAIYWIRQKILAMILNDSTMISIPAYVKQKINIYKECMHKISEKLCIDEEEVPLELVAKETGDSVKTIREYLSILKYKTTPSYESAAEKISLQEDTVTETAVEYSERLEMRRKIREAVHKIGNKRFEEIILRLYGFPVNDEDDDPDVDLEPQSLTQIGKDLGITKERVRQIREQALQIMRLKGIDKELAAML